MYTTGMKNKKDLFSNTEIAQLIENSKEELALMMGKAFSALHKEVEEVRVDVKKDIKDVDSRLILTKEDLIRKIDSTNIRIDDLAFNRVKYDDFNKLVTRVDKLESERSKKRVQ